MEAVGNIRARRSHVLRSIYSVRLYATSSGMLASVKKLDIQSAEVVVVFQQKKSERENEMQQTDDLQNVKKQETKKTP